MLRHCDLKSTWSIRPYRIVRFGWPTDYATNNCFFNWTLNRCKLLMIFCISIRFGKSEEPSDRILNRRYKYDVKGLLNANKQMIPACVELRGKGCGELIYFFYLVTVFWTRILTKWVKLWAEMEIKLECKSVPIQLHFKKCVFISVIYWTMTIYRSLIFPFLAGRHLLFNKPMNEWIRLTKTIQSRQIVSTLFPEGWMLFSHGSMAFGENEGSFIWWRSENGSLSVYYQVSSILLFKDKIKIKICSELRIPI